MPERSPSTGSDATHEPVLVADVVSVLHPRNDGVYVDCTLGLGGHTAALVAAGAGRVIGIDRDEVALAQARARLEHVRDRVEFVHGDYRDLPALLHSRAIVEVDGVLADLGVSSMQLDNAERGFSFRKAGPLDMRMDQSRGASLMDRLSEVDAGTLADVIFQYGEERHARRVARAIVAARDRGDLQTTTDLAAVVRRAAGGGTWQRLDPATRTFQALRIWVNGELEGLEAFVEAAVAVLGAGGRLVIIAFHSLEDRIVKHTMRRLAAAGVAALVTKRPIVPAEEEVERNPRARSARLRAMEKTA